MNTATATAHSRKSPDELLELKRQWVADPAWDLDDTSGFEAHRDELAAFAEAHHAKQQAAHEARMVALAAQLGCPGNLALAERWHGLCWRIEQLEARLGARA